MCTGLQIKEPGHMDWLLHSINIASTLPLPSGTWAKNKVFWTAIGVVIPWQDTIVQSSCKQQNIILILEGTVLTNQLDILRRQNKCKNFKFAVLLSDFVTIPFEVVQRNSNQNQNTAMLKTQCIVSNILSLKLM